VFINTSVIYKFNPSPKI